MKTTQHPFFRDEFGGTSVNAIALSASVFAAAVFGFGRVIDNAQAQTAMQTEVALTLPLADLRMTDPARAEVQSALRAMSATDLSLTYARIAATFRDYIGQDDLSVARALVDYAVLAEAELVSRNILRPSGTESAREMLTTYELVL
ncbi:hypothetical protein [Pararhodobacter zhoushanensis]|uniref:hypothetical protein n=1 Tax=Pararhodobacter zhoushanensis TaxID=2479545 RepID=UPI000F8EFF26|nr:hypothetical protein [Pararhodobacter zhoushanensis]